VVFSPPSYQLFGVILFHHLFGRVKTICWIVRAGAGKISGGLFYSNAAAGLLQADAFASFANEQNSAGVRPSSGQQTTRAEVTATKLIKP